MIEDSTLATTFSLNVKGTTALLGAVTGEVTSQPGTACSKLLVHNPEGLPGLWKVSANITLSCVH